MQLDDMLRDALQLLCLWSAFCHCRQQCHLSISCTFLGWGVDLWFRICYSKVYKPDLLYISCRGVGFLTYFQVKQLPNFLLASPILFLSSCSVIHYVRQWPEVFLSLGFRVSSVDRSSSTTKTENDLQAESSNLSDGQTLRRRRKSIKENLKMESVIIPTDRLAYMPAVVLPFVLHLVFLAATAFFVMHVQVATRFLSASPPLYWFASYVIGHTSNGKRWGYVIWIYCASYILLGSLLFSNFYPFTWDS